ncbi:hypothetical protein [Taibaiella helva]|uniref:hypothetical protein n=1 Tax=Taibaiella helva TaxID=2301235 RepID=UPI000E591CBA|nr:hypothetical protein [Taibaiella helva]
MKVSQTLLQALSLALVAGSCGTASTGQEASRQQSRPEARTKAPKQTDTLYRVDSLGPAKSKSCGKHYCPACGMG